MDIAKLQLDSFVNYLSARPREWHKGLSGHVLIVGGDWGFSGAPRLAGAAALRVGAGLVSIATRIEHAMVMNMTYPEIMCHGVAVAEELHPLVAKAKVIVVGPGLGQSAWGKMLWDYVSQQSLPLVVDADALNFLAHEHKNSNNWVLTPHPGEAARLLNTNVEIIQRDRIAAIKAIHQKWGGVCILKGANTLVLADHSDLFMCDKGNPGMATAGMGDVLSGVIGGFIAQGVPIGEAAKLGVLIHALAGDLAAKQGERGMIATDLMPYLRQLSN